MSDANETKVENISSTPAEPVAIIPASQIEVVRKRGRPPGTGSPALFKKRDEAALKRRPAAGRFKKGVVLPEQLLGAQRAAEARMAKAEERRISLDAALHATYERGRAHRIARNIWKMAEAEDKDMIKFLFERIDGKAVQQVEQTGSTKLHVTFERLG